MLLNVLAALSIALIGPALGEGTFNPSATSTSAPGATHTVSVGAVSCRNACGRGSSTMPNANDYFHPGRIQLLSE